jgi:lipopolysaccharide export LptBFGC system permease protein LptF
VSLLICTLALVSLFVIIDTFSDLSVLVDKWRENDEPVSALLKTILKMNATLLPVVLYDLVPVLTLASAMFTVVALKRSNELTPLLASGVSMYRILWPVFLMAILLTVFQVFDKEILIPRYSESIVAVVRMRQDPDRKSRNMVTIEDSYGNVVFAGHYRIAEKTQYGPHYTRYYKPARRLMVVINADRAVWSSRPAGWWYTNGTRVDYDRQGNVASQTPFGHRGIFVPFVAEAKPTENFALLTDVTPARLETEQVDLLYRPSLDLLEYIHQRGMRANIAFELNKRMAAPLANIVLLLIGLPFVLKREVKSPFLAIVLAAFIAGAFLALELLCENFAAEGSILTPLTGAWAPIIIFGPVGVLLFDSIES